MRADLTQRDSKTTLDGNNKNSQFLRESVGLNCSIQVNESTPFLLYYLPIECAVAFQTSSLSNVSYDSNRDLL